MLTPQKYTMSVAGNGFQIIHETGQFVRLLACTGKTSILVGLDDDPPQEWYPGKGVDVGVNHYDRIKISNPGAGAAIVEIEVGNSRSIDDRGVVALAGMATTLGCILTRLSANPSIAYSTIITLPASPAAGVQIAATSATRKKITIQAALMNTITGGPNIGLVYLGTTAAHCTDADCFAQLAAGMSWNDQYAYYGPIFGAGSDAQQQVLALQIS